LLQIPFVVFGGEKTFKKHEATLDEVGAALTFVLRQISFKVE